ncbi:hypothetical protein, partial [Burkholderia sp. GbtcB21]|uniref:hypothetical protein n=1 Tax=Burkholderia sp. GbtcB21 TaxID=2824766 RepID=UPI001C30BB71
DQALLVTDKAIFSEYDGFRIAYTQTNDIAANLWVKPHGLLHKKGLRQPTIECIEWEGITAFFGTDQGFCFDFIAAAFYLITRYEEYNTKSE